MKRTITNLFDEKTNGNSNLDSNFEFGITISKSKNRREEIISSTSLFLLGAKVEKYLVNLLKKELEETFKLGKYKNILIVGLGNRAIENDSLGPKTVEKLLISRGLNFSPSVCAISPNVEANTGIETFEIVKAISQNVKPDLVVVIDAFATNSISRLCSCFQLSESGISAGSGNGNKAKKISKKSLGVKSVLTIGVPTLIYASSIAKETSDLNLKNKLEVFENLMLSPTDVGKKIDVLSEIVATAINETLFPLLLPSEISSLSR